MSDILIKNMKMPDKATTIVIFSEGKARVFRQDIDHDEWLTAIEVPSPHGRLIDADEVFQRLKRFSIANPDLQEKIDNDICALACWLVTAPSIIEAEGT